MITKNMLMACKHIAESVARLDDRIKALEKEKDGQRFGHGALSPQQDYVEAMEELAAEYEAKKAKLMRIAVQIEKAMRELPPELQELVRMYYTEGKPWEEVNEMLSISTSTSKRWRKRALRLMGIDP